MFRVPSVNGIANQTVTHNKRRRGSFEASEDFLIKNGKLIDGASKKFFADSLSLIGKLFEIYFVRLIGTPNQNSKIYDVSFRLTSQ